MKIRDLISKAIDQTQEDKERAKMLETYVNDWAAVTGKIDRRQHVWDFRENELMGEKEIMFIPGKGDPARMKPEVLVKNILGSSQKNRNRFIGELTRKFMKTAERGNARVLADYFNFGFPVNFSDPETNETALHLIAAGGARQAMRMMLKVEGCDYLHKDKLGLLPSQKAFRIANDPVLSRLLVQKEKQQAEEQGLKLSYRHGKIEITPKL